ncbi:MAG: hypothetical protein IID46_07300 [Planctomycetes bacterium]|nr:hypothetical protein [Planctomycetota bacterium]
MLKFRNRLKQGLFFPEQKSKGEKTVTDEPNGRVAEISGGTGVSPVLEQSEFSRTGETPVPRFRRATSLEF